MKYLSFGENCASSSATDVGLVSQEEVGNPQAAKTIEGEVEAVEYVET